MVLTRYPMRLTRCKPLRTSCPSSPSIHVHTVFGSCLRTNSNSSPYVSKRQPSFGSPVPQPASGSNGFRINGYCAVNWFSARKMSLVVTMNAGKKVVVVRNQRRSNTMQVSCRPGMKLLRQEGNKQPSFLGMLSFNQKLKADCYRCEPSPGGNHWFRSIVSKSQSAKTFEPRDGPFDHPADATQMTPVRCATFAD